MTGLALGQARILSSFRLHKFTSIKPWNLTSCLSNTNGYHAISDFQTTEAKSLVHRDKTTKHFLHQFHSSTQTWNLRNGLQLNPVNTLLSKKTSVSQPVMMTDLLTSNSFNGSSMIVRSLNKTRPHTPVPIPPKPGLSFLSLRSLFSAPLPFMAYGLGGLIPFSAAPYYMYHINVYHPAIASAQLVYGACILSFLGGVSWGKSLDQPKSSLQSLGYSILLPLVGWSSVLIHPNPLSFVVLMSGVAYAGYIDTQFQDYPDWFKTMRFLLSSIVVLCLFSTFVFRFTKTPVKKSVEAKENKDSAS